MEIHSELLPGVFVLKPPVFKDHRGDFVKTYHRPHFEKLGLNCNFTEEYFTLSRKDVLRGMHLQLPPHDYEKLIYCIRGAVLDVVIDLRKNSPTFGEARSIELSEQNRLILMIPRAFAHGFLSLSNDSLMVYKTTTVHAPSHDAGVRWDSFNFDWPLQGRTPIISERDMRLPALADFQSPF